MTWLYKSHKIFCIHRFVLDEEKIFIVNLFLQHAGEVYGEKAILATELKELQSRLLSLSDERDKSLAILDEVLCTLACSWKFNHHTFAAHIPAFQNTLNTFLTIVVIRVFSIIT